MGETIDELRKREKELEELIRDHRGVHRMLKENGLEECWRSVNATLRYFRNRLIHTTQRRLTLELRSGKFDKGKEDDTK